MNLFFWLVLNLGVPIVGPIFTLALVAPAHGWRLARALIAASVKDGQLFWCATGLCAAAAYEAVTALQQGSRNAPILACCMVGLCFVGFICSALVMSGSMNVHNRRFGSDQAQGATPVSSRGFSRVEIGISIFFTILAAILFAFLHVVAI